MEKIRIQDGKTSDLGKTSRTATLNVDRSIFKVPGLHAKSIIIFIYLININFSFCKEISNFELKC